ncbi:hypothetical protein N0V85_008221 [Neurospora sp. IMI 360204]|nr:hypothetical protein N0V85_008221 [Neurospora sp. IMI 360204]
MPVIVDMDAEAAPKPRILVVSLEYSEGFDESVNRFLTPMTELATVQRVKKAATLTRLLSNESSEPYSALVLTDAALTLPENLPLWEHVLSYLRRTGATAVLTCQVACFVIPGDLDEFFRVSGLPDWKAGMYQRNIVVMNEQADGIRDATHFDIGNKDGLKAAYSVKSLCLSGVKSEHRWYVPDATQEDPNLNPAAVFIRGREGWDPERVSQQAAVAYGPVGEKGRIGWVGDINTEDPSVKVILALCGLDPAKAHVEPLKPLALRFDPAQGRFVEIEA